MYPAGELTLVLARQAALRRRIALRRRACAAEAGKFVRPLAVFDRVITMWRQLRLLMRLAGGLVGF